MKKITLVTVASIFFLSACDTVTKSDSIKAFPTKDIKVQAREHVKYSYQGKTYHWSGSLTIVNDPEGKWIAPAYDTDALVAKMIRKQLSKQGLSEAKEMADIVVAYGIGFDMNAINLKSYTDIDKGLKTSSTGTLVIVLADRHTKNVLWVASAEAEYKNLEPNIAKKRIKYAIEQVFKRFPG